MVDFVRISLYAIVFLGLSACGSSSDNGQDRSLRVGFDAAPVGVDPGGINSAYSAAIVQATYETLFEYDYMTGGTDLIPSLAEEMPQVSPDGKTIIVTIRPDSRFSDSELFPNGEGRVVTSTDVAYSIARHFDPSQPANAGWLWRDLLIGMDEWDGDYAEMPAGIAVIDDRTIRFSLSRSAPYFVHTLATSYSSIVPIESHGQDLSYRSVGSGAYKLDSIDTQRAILVANENYPLRTVAAPAAGKTLNSDADYLRGFYGKPLPLNSRVEIEFIEDPSARWLSLDNEELDIAALPDQLITPLLKREGPTESGSKFEARFRLSRYLANEVLFLNFRMDAPDFGNSNDPKRNELNRVLRCAISSAIDWEEMNRTFFDGDAVVFQGMVPPSVDGFSESGGTRRRNESLAGIVSKFLSEGIDLPKLTYGLAPSILARQNYDKFKSMLVSHGYPESRVSSVKYSSFGAVMVGAHEGKHLITQMSWTLDYLDASNTLQMFYGPNGSPGANLANFHAPAFDKYFEQMSEMEPSAARSEIIAKMNEILEVECPYSGSVSRQRVIASSKRVSVAPNHDILMHGRYFKYAVVND